MSAGAQRLVEITNPDDWKAGLNFNFNTLSVKMVGRATTRYEVILEVARHNLRSGNEKHRHRSKLDPARKRLNTVLRGGSTPEAIAEAAMKAIAGLTVQPRWRRDSTLCIESVCQPPPGEDTAVFYDTCLREVDERYGAANVLSAVVHRDQKRPHLHVLLLPIVDGRLAGNELTSGRANGKPAQRISFMTRMRRELGLRPDREPSGKAKSMAETFIGSGKGPKTRAAVAKADAALMRRATADDPTPMPTNPNAHPTPMPQPHIAQHPSPHFSPTLSTAFAPYFWHVNMGSITALAAKTASTAASNNLAVGNIATADDTSTVAALNEPRLPPLHRARLDSPTHCRSFIIPPGLQQECRVLPSNVVAGPWPRAVNE